MTLDIKGTTFKHRERNLEVVAVRHKRINFFGKGITSHLAVNRAARALVATSVTAPSWSLSHASRLS